MPASPLETEHHGRTAVRTPVEPGPLAAASAAVRVLDAVLDRSGVLRVAFSGRALLVAPLTMRRAGRLLSSTTTVDGLCVADAAHEP